MEEMDSEECLRLLRLIDADEDVEVTYWETEFLETVLTQTFPLTEKQIAIADRMINQYL